MQDDIIIKNDLILYFFHKKLKLNAWCVGVLVASLSLIMIPWAMYTGVWSGIDYSLSLSYTTWVGDLVLGATTAFIIRYYLFFPKVLTELYEKGVIQDGSSSYKRFVRTLELYFNRSSFYWVLGCSLTISIGVHVTFLMDPLHGWTEVNATDGWSLLGYYHMAYFTLLMTVIGNSIITFYKVVKALKRLEVSVDKQRLKYVYVRLCSFNAGGLKIVGDLAMRFNNIIFSLGVYFTIILLTVLSFKLSEGHMEGFHLWQIVEVAIPLPAYFVLAPTFFVYHLMPIHRIMKNRKEIFLNELVKKDLNTFDFSPKSLEATLSNHGDIKQLIAHSELFNIVRDFPIWPFNLKIITTLITTTVLPAVPLLLKVLYFYIGYTLF